MTAHEDMTAALAALRANDWKITDDTDESDTAAPAEPEQLPLWWLQLELFD